MSIEPNNRASRDGDIRRIAEEYSPGLFLQACKILGNPEDAKGAVQDVLLRVHLSLPGFRRNARVSTWIYRICVNVCLDRLDQGTQHSYEDGLEQIIDTAPDPFEQYNRKETGELVAALIAKLSPDQSVAITLFYIQEFNYGEIADIMQIPVGTVATHLCRGRKRLRRLMRGKKKGVL